MLNLANWPLVTLTIFTPLVGAMVLALWPERRAADARWIAMVFALAAFVLVVQAGLMAQNLGTAPQVNVAVQGQQGTQPEGTFLNLINWIGNVIAPVGAGGAALMAIGSFAMGRGFGKWVFTAIGLLMVSGLTRLLEYWIAQGTAGVT